MAGFLCAVQLISSGMVVSNIRKTSETTKFNFQCCKSPLSVPQFAGENGIELLSLWLENCLAVEGKPVKSSPKEVARFQQAGILELWIPKIGQGGDPLHGERTAEWPGGNLGNSLWPKLPHTSVRRVQALTEGTGCQFQLHTSLSKLPSLSQFPFPPFWKGEKIILLHYLEEE